MSTDLTAPQRNRYFYGLMMDADRFQKDQDYVNGKRRLLNRFVTGAGVLGGLGLLWDANAKSLAVTPGIALDPAGREIIVPAAAKVDITHITDTNGKPAGSVPADATIIVSLAYTEKKIDPVSVLVPDCDNPGGCSPSTIEEGYAILVTVATVPPPAPPNCAHGTFPLPPGAALDADIAVAIATRDLTIPGETSVPLGRLDLATGSLDVISDRPEVYDNAILYQLIVCLAAQVSKLAGTILNYVSGDNQFAKAGTALPLPLVVGLVDGSGNPVTGDAAPTFTVTSGGGSTGPVTAAANAGQYQTTWTLGTAGAQTVKAETTQSHLTVSFNAIIQP